VHPSACKISDASSSKKNKITSPYRYGRVEPRKRLLSAVCIR